MASEAEAARAKRTRKPATPSFGKALPGAKVVTFKKTPQVDLRLHIFEPKGHKPSDKTPAIVFFFGGGWMNGGPGQFMHHSIYLASRGMVAICAEYRVHKKHGTTPFECVADGKSAIRYVRQHAAELGIDPQRILAGGGSAGGHVALATATMSSKYDEQTEDLSISSRPAALCLFNPVCDTTATGWRGGPAQLKERARELSPVHHLPKDMCPAIIFHGTKDTTVPLENVQRLQKQMQALGVRCDLFTFEGEGHGFFNYGRKKGVPYKKTVYEMDRFLASLGYLQGEPTIEKVESRLQNPSCHNLCCGAESRRCRACSRPVRAFRSGGESPSAQRAP